MRYYIYKGGNVMGPYEPNQLPQFGLTSQTQVCIEGANQWLPAANFPEIAPFIPKVQADGNKGLIGFIASIVALVAQWIVWENGIPFLGELLVTVIGIIGLINCIKGFKEKNKTLAVIGLILNIIGLLWSLFCYICLLGFASIKGIGHMHSRGLF